MAIVTPIWPPLVVCNCCVIEVFGDALCCHVPYLDFSEGIRAFVIGLSEISSFSFSEGNNLNQGTYKIRKIWDTIQKARQARPGFQIASYNFQLNIKRRLSIKCVHPDDGRMGIAKDWLVFQAPHMLDWPPQFRQDPDPRRLWLIVGTPTALGS